MSEWIACSDRLPESETPVLVLFDEEDRMEVAELRWERPTYEETFKAFRYWDSPWMDGQIWEGISHWMPLPEPPEAEK